MTNSIKLAEICKISGRVGWRGYTVNDLRNEGPWVIGANDITSDHTLDLSKAKHISREKYEESPEIMIELNDILIVKVGSTIGKIAIVNKDIGEACINPNTVLLKKCTFNPSFLYYYLISSTGQTFIKNHSSASAQAALNQTDLKEMPVKNYDLNIQNQIADCLNAFNSKITLNNKINQKLESIAKLLYDYWFVQFDFPDANEQPYKSSDGKMVYNKDLKREIPEGWEFSTIKKELKTSLGGTPSTKIKEFWSGNLPWLNSGEIAEFPIINAEEKITQDAIDKSATKLMPIGTVALSITRHIRPSILAIEACANQSVVGIFESEKLKTSYIYPYIQNEVPRFMILRTGAQQPHINKATIDNSTIIVPSENILKKYYKLANPLYEKIINNAFQNQKLTALRDWLLPMLMNGQVTVGEAEEKLGMVAEAGEKYRD